MNHTHHHSNAMQKVANTSGHKHPCSMMKMYFHAGFMETILFKPWKTTSIPMFIGSWIFIFILSILFEGIREFRQYSMEEQLSQTSIPSNDRNENESEPMNTESPVSTISVNKKKSPLSTNHVLHSLLYIVYLSLSYILMLIVMTFNVYLFLAIIFGIGIGHFLFTWSCIRPSTDN